MFFSNGVRNVSGLIDIELLEILIISQYNIPFTAKIRLRRNVLKKLAARFIVADIQYELLQKAIQ